MPYLPPCSRRRPVDPTTHLRPAWCGERGRQRPADDADANALLPKPTPTPCCYCSCFCLAIPVYCSCFCLPLLLAQDTDALPLPLPSEGERGRRRPAADADANALLPKPTLTPCRYCSACVWPFPSSRPSLPRWLLLSSWPSRPPCRHPLMSLSLLIL